MKISDLCTHPKKKLFAVFFHFPYKRLEGMIGNAFILNEKLKDEFSSVVVKRFEIEVNNTHMGPEKITTNIQGVGPESIVNLDNKGIVKQGTYVKKGDILVGKISPCAKRKPKYSPEESLLKKILGEKAFEKKADVKDTSIRWPYEDEGVVLYTRYFSREDLKNLMPYKLEAALVGLIQVDVAITRPLRIGDLFQDSVGNKGVVAQFSTFPFFGQKRFGDIHLFGSIQSDFVKALENPEIKNVWCKNNHWLYFFDRRITNEKQIWYWKEDFNGKLEEKAKSSYKLLGHATIGFLTLEKLTNHVEEKISARGTGYYNYSKQPIIENLVTGFTAGVKISEKELSALKEYPELIKEAIVLRSERSEMKKKYAAL